MKPQKLLSLVLFAEVLTIFTVESVKLAPELKRCSQKSADLQKCLTIAIQDAIPKLANGNKDMGFPVFDPLDIAYLKIGPGQHVNVDQIFKNVKLYGYSKAIINKVKLDLAKKMMELDITMPLLEKKADYHLNGSLLLLPVYGDGKSQVDLVNTREYHHYALDIVEKSGNKYVKIVGSRLKKTPELMRFRFDNLFNGNKLLGDNINKVLNTYWKDIWADIGKEYEDAFATINMELINKLFDKVPLSELFDE